MSYLFMSTHLTFQNKPKFIPLCENQLSYHRRYAQLYMQSVKHKMKGKTQKRKVVPKNNSTAC